MAHILAPSLLSADFTDLRSAVKLVDESPAQWLHLDVMDGVFVPNISYGPSLIKADLDLVLVMSVNPGFGGQKFIANTYSKLNRLRDLRAQKGSRALLEVDGGVGIDNRDELLKNGADVLVAGNSVFGANDPVSAIKALMAT